MALLLFSCSFHTHTTLISHTHTHTFLSMSTMYLVHFSPVSLASRSLHCQVKGFYLSWHDWNDSIWKRCEFTSDSLLHTRFAIAFLPVLLVLLKIHQLCPKSMIDCNIAPSLDTSLQGSPNSKPTSFWCDWIPPKVFQPINIGVQRT